MNPGLFWGQMITVYGCGGTLVSGTIPHTCSTSHFPHSWCNGLGVIAYDSRSALIVIRGTLTGQRYVDDILQPHVGPFLNGLPGAIFQQDNAHPHTARVAQDFLRHF
ncbi:DDE_3 domain-containing protein [Trichonephila clavipes]|nr:DDE_3 domain-containing protein [Trichonephila clavipes]